MRKAFVSACLILTLTVESVYPRLAFAMYDDLEGAIQNAVEATTPLVANESSGSNSRQTQQCWTHYLPSKEFGILFILCTLNAASIGILHTIMDNLHEAAPEPWQGQSLGELEAQNEFPFLCICSQFVKTILSQLQHSVWETGPTLALTFDGVITPLCFLGHDRYNHYGFLATFLLLKGFVAGVNLSALMTTIQGFNLMTDYAQKDAAMQPKCSKECIAFFEEQAYLTKQVLGLLGARFAGSVISLPVILKRLGLNPNCRPDEP